MRYERTLITIVSGCKRPLPPCGAPRSPRSGSGGTGAPSRRDLRPPRRDRSALAAGPGALGAGPERPRPPPGPGGPRDRPRGLASPALAPPAPASQGRRCPAPRGRTPWFRRPRGATRPPGALPGPGAARGGTAAPRPLARPPAGLGVVKRLKNRPCFPGRTARYLRASWVAVDARARRRCHRGHSWWLSHVGVQRPGDPEAGHSVRAQPSRSGGNVRGAVAPCFQGVVLWLVAP
jgi:hypothetical protein